jgi:hypothetical protein
MCLSGLDDVPFSPGGRRWREATDEGAGGNWARSTSPLIRLARRRAIHLLPQGEKGKDGALISHD